MFAAIGSTYNANATTSPRSIDLDDHDVSRPPIAFSTDDIHADLLIVGGTESGCAAAIQAARMGVGSITLVNDIAWLGGQFTAESLVAIDENRGPRNRYPFPRSGLFKELLDRIEADNLARYGAARPGFTHVHTTCRPVHAEAIFRAMLQPYVDTGQVRVISDHYPVSATVENGALKTVTFAPTEGEGDRFTVHAPITIDASDWGEVVQAAGAAFEYGPDLKSTYGEPLAPESRDGYPLTDMNPISYTMLVIETNDESPIPPPSTYDERNYSWQTFDQEVIYQSRRVVDRHELGIDHPDVVLLCFTPQDYPLDVLPQRVVDALEADEPGGSKKNIVCMTRTQRQIIFDDAKLQSLGFLRYLQTVVHDENENTRYSFRRFALSDEFGTPDQLPMKPYIRESLRLKALYMMKQQDTMDTNGARTNGAFADQMYYDGVASWIFEFDFHPTGRTFIDGDPAGPWQWYFKEGRTWGPPYSGRSLFPMRSLIPKSVDGLLGAQKNLGYSSIVSSAVRLHDQCMAIGQAAAATAVVALRHDVTPRTIPDDPTLLEEVRRGVCSRLGGGIPSTLWPYRDLATDHPAFEAVNLLAARRAFPMTKQDVDFLPDAPATEEWRREVVARTMLTKEMARESDYPGEPMTRGEFAMRWYDRVKDAPERPYERLSENDADGDGVVDREDPMPYGHDVLLPISTLRFEKPNEDLPEEIVARTGTIRWFNFAGPDVKSIDGFAHDRGLPFDVARGYGWRAEISANHRARGLNDDPKYDTFIFTRAMDTWEYEVENGTYYVTICIGDSGFEQPGQFVRVEGQVVADGVDTYVGEFFVASAKVDVTDGRVTVDIGTDDPTLNTCLNWLRIARLKTE